MSEKSLLRLASLYLPFALLAVLAPARGSPVALASVTSRSDLSNTAAEDGYTAYLAEPGREGLWTWRSGPQFLAFAKFDLKYQCAYVAGKGIGAWVREHTRGTILAAWCGAVFDWKGSRQGNSPRHHVAKEIQAAIDLVVQEAESEDEPYAYGGHVVLPKGTGYFDDGDVYEIIRGKKVGIWIRPGVTIEGQGPYATSIRFGGTRATDYPIYAGTGGGPEAKAAFACGLANLGLTDDEAPDAVKTGDVFLYTDSCQQAQPVLANVYLWGLGGRIMFDAEHGYGGSALLNISNVDANTRAGQEGFAENPIFKLNYLSGVTTLANIALAGAQPGSHTRVLVEVDSGTVHIQSGECEEAFTCILNLVHDTDAYIVDVRDFVANSNIGNALIATGSTADHHPHTCVLAVSSLRNIFQDNRSGGPFNGGTIPGGMLPREPAMLTTVCR